MTRQNKPRTVFQMRLPKRELDKLKRLARRAKMSASEYLRDHIRRAPDGRSKKQ